MATKDVRLHVMVDQATKDKLELVARFYGESEGQIVRDWLEGDQIALMATKALDAGMHLRRHVPAGMGQR